jgi:hypothetical protein
LPPPLAPSKRATLLISGVARSDDEEDTVREGLVLTRREENYEIAATPSLTDYAISAVASPSGEPLSEHGIF